jgi:hypothetical protein
MNGAVNHQARPVQLPINFDDIIPNQPRIINVNAIIALAGNNDVFVRRIDDVIVRRRMNDIYSHDEEINDR